MVISDNGASAEGGVVRVVQRDAVLQPGARELRREPRAGSTSWAARRPTTTTRGAGPGPATRRSGAGSARPTAAVRPTRSSSPGPPGWRRAERCARSTRTRSTWSRPCSTRWASSRRPRSAASQQSPLEGVSFAHTFDAPDAATKHDTQYFEMFGHRSIYHDGVAGGVPVAGADLHRGGTARPHAGRPDHPRGARPARPRGLGALRHAARPDRVAQRRRRAPRPAARA